MLILTMIKMTKNRIIIKLRSMRKMMRMIKIKLILIRNMGSLKVIKDLGKVEDCSLKMGYILH